MSLRDRVLNVIPGDSARKISKALTPADPHIGDHADALHPVKQRRPYRASDEAPSPAMRKLMERNK